MESRINPPSQPKPAIAPKSVWALRVAFLGSAALLALASEAHAQQVLEEIVVTAERRDQSLQDVPISATVLTGKDLAEKGIDNVSEIQQIAPGVAISTYGKSTFVNIRGVGIAQSSATSSPGVAYYIDGLLIPNENFLANGFYDINSIEVLRGPQGTLTGQNSTGGAIYIRTPEPKTDKVSAYLDQTIGNYDAFRTTGALNLPLGDKAAIRVAGIYDRRDSFTKNIGPGPSDPGDVDMHAIRATLALFPADGFTLSLRGEYFGSKNDNIPVKRRNDTVSSDPFEIQEDARSFLKQNGYRISGEGRIDLSSDVQLRLLASYQDMKAREQADGDRSATTLPVPAGLPATPASTALYPGRVSLTKSRFETFISEANLLSTGSSPFQWVVGLFYLDGKIPLTVERDNYNTTDFVRASSTIDVEVRNQSKSAFGQINYSLGDRWALIAGLRYSEDAQDIVRFAVPGPPPPGGYPFTTSQNSSQVTGKAGVQYHLDSRSMIYGTMSKGYKAGGSNLPFFQPSYGPERNWVYEAGAKLTLLDNRMRMNGAIFYSDYSNIQFQSIRSFGGFPPLSLTENAASARSYGAELEIAYAFDRLAFNIGTSYLHSEFAKLATLNNPDTGLSEIVPKGRTLPFAPKWSFSAGVQYDVPIGHMTLTPRLQYSHLASQWATPFRSLATRVDSRNILDFRLTLRPNDRLLIEAFVTNLTDDVYIASQVQGTSGSDGGSIYGAPRQFGVRAKIDF